MLTPFFHIAGFVLAASVAAQDPDALDSARSRSLQPAPMTDGIASPSGPDSAWTDTATSTTRSDSTVSVAPPLGSAREARLETREVRGHGTANASRRIERDELERSASLAEALSRRPGVRVRTTGGMGGYTGLSLRGSSGQQVDVTLDGVPLGGSAGSAVDLGPYALDGLERAEILQATQEGSGGSPRLDLVSRKGFLHRGISMRVGSFGERALSGWWSDATNRVSVAAWHERADNDWPFPWDNGTEYETSDDRTVNLRGNDFAGWGASVALRPLDDIQGSLRWESSEKGISAPWIAEPSARWSRDALQGEASAGIDLGTWRLGGASSLRRASSHWTDQGKSLGWDSDARSEEEAWTARGRVTLHRTQDDWWGWRTAFEARTEHSTRKSLGRDQIPMAPDASRRAGAIEAGWAGQDPSTRVGFDLGLRREWLIDELDAARDLAGWIDDASRRERTSDRAAARIWSTPWGGFGLEAGASTTLRAPDFGEWMGDNGAGLPNPDLESEEVSQADLAARWKSLGLTTGITGWIARYEDPIGVVQRGSSPLSRHENLPGYLVRGFDVEASWSGPFAGVSSVVTWQKARIESDLPLLDGTEPRRTPRWKGCSEVSVGPWHGLRSGWTLDAQGESWATELRTEDDLLPGRILHGIWARWDHASLSLLARARNLTDEHPEDWADLPLSGRQYSLTLFWNPSRPKPGDTP